MLWGKTSIATGPAVSCQCQSSQHVEDNNWVAELRLLALKRKAWRTTALNIFKSSLHDVPLLVICWQPQGNQPDFTSEIEHKFWVSNTVTIEERLSLLQVQIPSTTGFSSNFQFSRLPKWPLWSLLSLSTEYTCSGVGRGYYLPISTLACFRSTRHKMCLHTLIEKTLSSVLNWKVPALCVLHLWTFFSGTVGIGR